MPNNDSIIPIRRRKRTRLSGLNRETAKKDALLEEYEICSYRADQTTTLQWTLVTALLSLNAGGLLFAGQIFLQSISESPDHILTITPILAVILISEVVAGAAIFILKWWNKVANRWNSYTHVWYRRMQEIESNNRFGIWANRDIYILDAANKEKNNLSQEEKVRKSILEEGGILARYTSYSKESIRALRDELTNIMPLAWLFLIVIEIVIAAFVILSTVNNNLQEITAYNWILFGGITLGLGVLFFLTFRVGRIRTITKRKSKQKV